MSPLTWRPPSAKQLGFQELCARNARNPCVGSRRMQSPLRDGRRDAQTLFKLSGQAMRCFAECVGRAVIAGLDLVGFADAPDGQ